jgi:hypothetical protein
MEERQSEFEQLSITFNSKEVAHFSDETLSKIESIVGQGAQSIKFLDITNKYTVTFYPKNYDHIVEKITENKSLLVIVPLIYKETILSFLKKYCITESLNEQFLELYLKYKVAEEEIQQALKTDTKFSVSIKWIKSKVIDDIELNNLLFAPREQFTNSPEKLSPAAIKKVIMSHVERNNLDIGQEYLTSRKLLNDLREALDCSAKRNLDLHPFNVITNSCKLLANLKKLAKDGRYVSPRAWTIAKDLENKISDEPKTEDSFYNYMFFRLQKLEQRAKKNFMTAIEHL